MYGGIVDGARPRFEPCDLEFCVVYKVEGPKGTKIVRAPGQTQSLTSLSLICYFQIVVFMLLYFNTNCQISFM